MKDGTASTQRLTALTPIAIVFTLVSLCWTGWSITGLVQSGWWGILAAVSVDGLWGVVQYLSYKGIGGRFVEAAEWVTLGVACGLLAWHGWNITHAAAFAGALPPIVAKIAWTGDVRLRRDPTAPTAEQEAEINSVIRDIEREAAEEVALIRAQGKVAIERDDVTFQVELERIRKRDELSRRTPLGIAASAPPRNSPRRPRATARSKNAWATNVLPDPAVARTRKRRGSISKPASVRASPEPRRVNCRSCAVTWA